MGEVGCPLINWQNKMPFDQPSDRIIAALDVDDANRAVELARMLKGQVGYLKIGLQLFTAAGPAIVRQLLAEDCRIFLDLKLHDIPNTVAGASVEAGRLGVHMITLHTLGGETMLRQARETVLETADRENWPAPQMLGVTILTSMDQSALTSIGIDHPLDQEVLRLAKSAHNAGLDGIVCSPLELNLLRQEKTSEFVFVTPGIRWAKLDKDDQSRTMHAWKALAQGADYLVVGRPIIEAPDPARAAQDLVEEIRSRQHD